MACPFGLTRHDPARNSPLCPLMQKSRPLNKESGTFAIAQNSLNILVGAFLFQQFFHFLKKIGISHH